MILKKIILFIKKIIKINTINSINDSNNTSDFFKNLFLDPMDDPEYRIITNQITKKCKKDPKFFKIIHNLGLKIIAYNKDDLKKLILKYEEDKKCL